MQKCCSSFKKIVKPIFFLEEQTAYQLNTIPETDTYTFHKRDYKSLRYVTQYTIHEVVCLDFSVPRLNRTSGCENILKSVISYFFFLNFRKWKRADVAHNMFSGKASTIFLLAWKWKELGVFLKGLWKKQCLMLLQL